MKIRVVLSAILNPLIKLVRFDYKFEWKALMSIAAFLQKKKLRELVNKKVINVVFFVIDESSWKYSEVYERLKNNKRFRVHILVCPMVNHGKEAMLRTLENSFSWFRRNGYDVTVSYDKNTRKYINARKEFNPDIIFYSNPYKGLIDNRYYITHYLDVLTIHTPYAFNNNYDFNFCYNELLHNLVWRFYFETEEHKKYAQQAAMAKGRNVVVTGYTGIEKLIDGYVPKNNPWKIKDKSHKRIIWGPHWTIQQSGGSVNYSCFLQYSESMLDLARRYKDLVQFVFKPHPLLRVQLERLWGKERTDKYYSLWASLPNTRLCESAYQDLFLTSDAMIHDSGSFINEYLYVNKPVMRTMKHGESVSMYNPFSQNSLKFYYKAYNIDDVDLFIYNVIHGIDPMMESRTKYIKDCLMPPSGKLPSENIVNDIINSIDNQILYRY